MNYKYKHNIPKHIPIKRLLIEIKGATDRGNCQLSLLDNPKTDGHTKYQIDFRKEAELLYELLYFHLPSGTWDSFIEILAETGMLELQWSEILMGKMKIKTNRELIKRRLIGYEL